MRRPFSVATASRLLLHAGSAVAAWLGMTFAVELHEVSGLSPWQLRGLVCVAVATLLAGLLLGIADAGGSLFEQLRAGLAVVWRAALPLGFLPLCHGDLRLIPALASVALAGRYAPAAAFSRLHERRAWQIAMLGFAGTLSVAFVSVGRSLTGSGSNDTAYYYGVARYIVKSHQYREPIVWQFLSHATSVLHRPFDYWHGLASLFLVPIFAVFGTSYRVAGTSMGLVSASTLLLFTYLVSVAAPLRNAALQVLAVLLFALAPSLVALRFDVETIPFVHVWLLVALIALARRRLALGAASACLMFASRADAASLSALLCLCAAYLAFDEAEPARALRGVVVTVVGFLLLYVGYHLALFGTPGPPGALVAARLSDGNGPYCWFAQPPMWTWAQRVAAPFVADRVQAALNALQQAAFFPNYPTFLACALIGSASAASRRRSVDRIARLLLFGGSAAIALASPAVFAWWRSLHPLFPVFVLVGAYGAETVLDGLSSFLRRRATRPGWLRFSGGVTTLLFVFGMLSPLKVEAAPSPAPAFTQELNDLDATFAGQTVMSARSWYVLAYTSAPSVGLPYNGEAAVALVLRRYDVKWLLIANGETLISSTDVVAQLIAGQRQDIGGVPMHLVRRSDTITLFHVD